ncbi:DUF1289 domain-containing protein [Sphingorhabdus sp.]|uniref:DUF1289 domain-containing protein n=1 Tax=Sphingorhabdus sp. TaxID=1902408 RepID=UPI003983BDE1
MVQFPPSPCKGHCKLNVKSRFCSGCGRTMDEIGEWGSASALRQIEITNRASGRLIAKISE